MRVKLNQCSINVEWLMTEWPDTGDWRGIRFQREVSIVYNECSKQEGVLLLFSIYFGRQDDVQSSAIKYVYAFSNQFNYSIWNT